MEKINNKKIFIMVFGVVTLIAGLLGLTYAYFSSNPSGINETTNMRLLSENLTVEFIDGEEIKLNRMLPGFTVTKTFSVKNNASAGMYYDIVFRDIESTIVGNDFVYTLTSTNSGGTVNERVMPTESEPLVTKKYIEGNTTQTYTMNITYKNRPVDQSENQGAIFNGRLEFQSPYDMNGNTVAYVSNYEYTGSAQTFTPAYSGYYQIEAWGAEGGSSSTYLGGKGGYTSGKIYLEQGEELYLYLGGQGTTTISGVIPGGYNGGGTAYGYSDGNNGSGGGATDVKYGGVSLNDRIMVAGGGGGTVDTESPVYGNAGGLISNNAKTGASVGAYIAYGATQFRGGYGNSNSKSGSFGLGGAGGSTYRAGGGGGYYGGGVAMYASSGGSSYISGYAGVVSGKLINNSFVEPANLTNEQGQEYNTLHYSGKYFLDGEMQSGVNTGHGKAKITYLGTEKPLRINTKLDNVRYIKDCATKSWSAGRVYWEEIQAIKNGVNLAKGILPIGSVPEYNITTYPYSLITDGKIGVASNTSTTDNSNKCITIDLGSTYDLEEIAVWHLHAPDYTAVTENNITYVSSDNTNWIPVINETISETSEGKRISAYRDINNGYIQDGLMVWYDGISNTGNIRSTTTTTWKDLSGNGRDGTLSGGTWGTNHLSFDGTDYKVVLGNHLIDLFKLNNTVEVVINFTDANARDVIFGNYNSANGINYERYSDSSARIYFNSGATSDAFVNAGALVNSANMTLTYVYDKQNGDIHVYKNGTEMSGSPIHRDGFASYNYDFPSAYLGNDYRTGSTSFKGRIYSFRVYQRTLTDSEIEHNYEVDRVKFGLN